MYPKIIIDEIRDLTSPTGIASRIRVRIVELDPETIGVVFSENRIPDLDAEREVINPGTSITNQIEWLAHLVETEWKLLPSNRRVRWFEHYSGLTSQRAPDLLMCNSTFFEITFGKIFEPVFPFKSLGDEAAYFKVGSRYVPADTFRGRWRLPSFRQIPLDEGRALTGLDL